MSPARRASDHMLYVVCRGATGLWDWIDRRNIDKHAVSLVVLWGTWQITTWAMEFSSLFFTTGKNGLELAAVIAAVTAPYMALQAAALSFYFRARTA